MITLGVSVALAVWRVNHEHREKWERFTENSLPKSKWANFNCLTKLDPKFVDFRSWRKGFGYEACWEIWCTPSTSTSLREHLREFKLVKHPMSNEMTSFLYQNMPIDWVLEHDTEFEVYQPKSQPENWTTPQLDLDMLLGRSIDDGAFVPRSETGPDRCQFLLHDIENNVIYFYTMARCFRIR